MELLITITIGLLAGLHTSTWGMYKDAPYEGFTWLRYFRSTILSVIIAVAVYKATYIAVTQAANMVVLYGFVYVIERAMTEFYKTFLREQDQSKYFIPMQFSVQGEVVKSRTGRLTAGAAYFAGIVGVVLGFHYLQKSGVITSGWVALLIVGSIGGWISAFGGAWKDAPKEGFEILKFFRSPLIALTYSFMLANFTDNYLYICFGGLGYTVSTIETYKTFFFPSKPRGKFAGKEIQFPEISKQRQFFVPLYVLIWIAVITTIIVAFVQPHEGLI